MSEAKTQTISERAIDAIAASGVTDFKTPLLWAQWCRSVAIWAAIGDADAVEQLLKDAGLCDL